MSDAKAAADGAAPTRVLVIDDEETVRDLLKRRLERRGMTVAVAPDGEQALALAASFAPEVAISDIRMPGLDGFAVLKSIHVPTILITGHGDKESAIQAVEAGAFAFFEKPFDLDVIEVAVKRAAEKFRWQREREELLTRLDRLCQLQGREIENFQRKEKSSFIGESPLIIEIKATLAHLARKPKATLLVTGESGTGKEVVAMSLHQLSHPDTALTPFVALNCAAIPPDLLESELFGHEKGAFSGAANTRVGLAEAAREGTLFLDEIGDMDPRHQTKLLRLVQERKFRRVGGTKELSFNGRIVAATHRNLKERIAQNLFREDLYYRLSVVAVELPPLRARGEDIAGIAEMLCRKHGLRGLAPELLAEIRSYSWPGNIRELNNYIERASILNLHDDKGYLTAPLPQAEETAISRAPHSPTGALTATEFDEITGGAELDIKSLRARVLEDFDRRLIEQAFLRHGGNISAVAKALGLDRKNLSRRLRELGLEPKKRAA